MKGPKKGMFLTNQDLKIVTIGFFCSAKVYGAENIALKNPFIFSHFDRILKHTASVPHSRTIAILWYDFRSLWPKKNMLKSHATALSFWLQADTSWIFQMRYWKVLNANWLQSYRLSKLAIKKNSRPFGFDAMFFASLHSKWLLSERPGFDPRLVQTLRAYNFAAPWPIGQKILFKKI